MTPLALRGLVIAAAMFALVGLWISIRGYLKFGKRSRLAPPAGSEWQGVQYALLAGMMPWAKESARHHLPTYFAGILYHLGIAGGFLVLIAALSSWAISGVASITLLVLNVAGAAAGLGLLAKRAMTPALRAISTPDDILSNGLVTLFLLAAGFTLWMPSFATTFLIVAILLLLYVPLGKIRHCFLFFHSRITFGRFFGRRGILPHPAAGAGESHVGR
jgi:hypothetical protein